MKRTAFVLSSFLLVALAHAASFDCHKAQTNIEKLVCDDQELSKLDDDLGVAYRKAKENSQSKSDITLDQHRWLRGLNNCRDRYCIKNSYEARLKALQSMTPAEAPEAGPPWVFRLTQGGELPVCRAYLERLNHGQQANYPFCDRPETGKQYGFTSLSRKPLSYDQIYELAKRASGFMRSRNQDSLDLENAWRLKHKLPLVGALARDDIPRLLDKDILVWQYDPPVDIDNDGQPDRIVVWRGSPVGNHLPGCGSHWGEFDEVMGDVQMAFFVDSSLTRIDVFNTVKVFGHPLGSYSIYDGVKKQWVVTNDFWSVGDTIGIFEYDGIYYFDTFLSPKGDFKGARQNDPKISSTLGVFVHQGGETKQACEYYWENNPNSR